MNSQHRKTLNEFPKFNLSHLTHLGTDSQGFATFELKGEFDRLPRSREATWFWLLIGERDAVCAEWKSVGPDTSATISVSAKEMPRIAGMTLYYLSPYWQAFNIWMVLDEHWGWERMVFQATDAVAETYQASDVSIIDGRAVNTWTKFSRADKPGPKERHVPVFENTELSAAPRLVPGGWDHEHCEFCKKHIEAGQFGYRDEDGRWLCESCHDKYVTTRDLSFVDEL